MQAAEDSRTEIKTRAQLLDASVLAEEIKQEVALAIETLYLAKDDPTVPVTSKPRSA